MNGPADLSVVICSLNGAAGIARCLDALSAQQTDARLEIIVVDDGSADGTGDVAEARRAKVIRHPVNRGLAAARNSGVAAATAPVVAFLDDDCEPTPNWAASLLAAYEDGAVGVGGPVAPAGKPGFMLGYLIRNNPLTPLELDLARSESLLYRLSLYLRAQWQPRLRTGRREVYTLPGANMSFRREALLDVGGFDERFRFGAEDTDFCLRWRWAGRAGLVFDPDVAIRHHFVTTLPDSLRRSRTYGQGGARMYRKWPSLPLTIFPGPLAALCLLLASAWFPVCTPMAAVLPLALNPKAVRAAVRRRRVLYLADAYVQLLLEAAHNWGYVRGLWRYRRLSPETRGAQTLTATAAGDRG
jgi:glycosyltransferase involved in cell wall biosynthesis